jgi:Ala-tRNA(Pro) deacylase
MIQIFFIADSFGICPTESYGLVADAAIVKTPRLQLGKSPTAHGWEAAKEPGIILMFTIESPNDDSHGFEKENIMATRRIREFLDGSAVRYVTITHSPAYTSQERAESTHIPGWKMAKTVIVRIDGRIAMAVVPASRDVELELLRRQVRADEVVLAQEAEFTGRFDGCQLGTVPPFGNLFGVETFADRELLRRDEIAFAAGTHTDVIVMRTADYERLTRPTPLHIAVEAIGHEYPAVSL